MTDCRSCERMAKAETAITNLKGDNERMEKKLDKLHWWITTTAVGVGITLLLNIIKVSAGQ